MSTVVAVAGGSSGLGRSIVDALQQDGQYKILIFSRTENALVEKESGARVLAADYSNVDALVTLLESNNVEVLITTANTVVDPTPEFNMITAAARSRSTRRFIPNAWSALQFKDERVTLSPKISEPSLIAFSERFKDVPLAQARLQSLARLQKTDLEYTAIYPGLFMEYAVEGLPTNLIVNTLMLDVKHNTAALPNKGEAKITLTYTRDIAQYIPKLLTLKTWERAYFVAGDTKSWNDIVAAAEQGKGVKFDVKYDSLEKLREGTPTELPGHEQTYEYFGGKERGRAVVQKLTSQYGLWMEEGLFTYEEGTKLGDVFPEVKALTLEDAWKRAADRNA